MKYLKNILNGFLLFSTGYCFSASAPPLLMAAAMTALDVMEEDTSIFEKLTHNCLLMQEQLKSHLPSDLAVFGHPESVVKHIRLAVPSGDKTRDDRLLQKIVSQVKDIEPLSN
jgi:7-keto-8-aminopelargonate synthetase-like enzyme